MNKKISVVIPTYNRAVIIKDVLKSVLAQTYTNWECFIVDDGSTDNSEEVIREFIRDDKRFIFIKRPDNRKKGAASCRNIGLEHSTGEYIQFLDSDDSLAKNKFEIQLSALSEAVDKAVATCKFAIQRPSWSTSKIYPKLSTYRNFNNPTDLFTQFARGFTYFPPHIYLTPIEVIQKAGFWEEELRVNDDGEYFSRVILNCSKIIFCETTHANYRTGAENRVTGELSQASGIENYIKCWEFTDRNIYQRIGIKNHVYIRAAKRNLQKRLKREQPELIPHHRQFLSGRWKYVPYMFHFLYHKIRSEIPPVGKNFFF